MGNVRKKRNDCQLDFNLHDLSIGFLTNIEDLYLSLLFDMVIIYTVIGVNVFSCLLPWINSLRSIVNKVLISG